MPRSWIASLIVVSLLGSAPAAWGQGEWEITPDSEQALARGLKWLHENQGPEGNWGVTDLGVVSMGALAFLSAGHTPGKGKYGKTAEKALDYVLKSARPNGLLNIAGEQRDMYNHGLSTFVLGQAYGMTGDRRLSIALDKALKVIVQTQCDDGGWDYHARPQPHGHDLSLAVMQAKALRSAVDSGLEIPPEVIDLAIADVRRHYTPAHNQRTDEAKMREGPGQFTYGIGGGGSIAMAAAGVVCMQEFGQYEDWRIGKNIEIIGAAIAPKVNEKPARNGNMPFDAYTLYYVGQALYQVGGKDWETHYPTLRNQLAAGQVHSPDPKQDGKWIAGGHLGGGGGLSDLYGTSVGCFILAIPNRYLPILQEGKIESLKRPGSG